MFRILLILLALAAYGAHSLVGSFGSQEPVETTVGSTLAGIGSAALSAVAGVAGLDTTPLPASGCQESALSHDNLMALVSTLPEAQQTALMALINKGSEVATVQWYSGSDGVGLCLPGQGIRVMLPAVVSQMLSDLAPG